MKLYISKLLSTALPIVGVLCIFGFAFAGNISMGWILFLVGLYKEKGHQIRAELATKNIVLRWAVYYVLLFGVIILGAYGKGYEVAGFIYAQF